MPLFCRPCKKPCPDSENTNNKQNCPREKKPLPSPLPCCPRSPCPEPPKKTNCPSFCQQTVPCPSPRCPQQEKPQVNPQLCCQKRTCPKAKESPCPTTAKYRNAYLNFVEEYRRNHKHLLPWQVTTRAACCWNNLSEEEKCQYKIDAQNAKYMYKSKNKSLNKVLKTLRSALKSPTEIDVAQLAALPYQLDKWKEDVLECIDYF